jgi:hypothetical protein
VYDERVYLSTRLDTAESARGDFDATVDTLDLCVCVADPAPYERTAPATTGCGDPAAGCAVARV